MVYRIGEHRGLSGGCPVRSTQHTMLVPRREGVGTDIDSATANIQQQWAKSRGAEVEHPARGVGVLWSPRSVVSLAGSTAPAGCVSCAPAPSSGQGSARPGQGRHVGQRRSPRPPTPPVRSAAICCNFLLTACINDAFSAISGGLIIMRRTPLSSGRMQLAGGVPCPGLFHATIRTDEKGQKTATDSTVTTTTKATPHTTRLPHPHRQQPVANANHRHEARPNRETATSYCRPFARESIFA
ncbi:hypothetical protein BDV95DRAFT_261519 [Massariosphaeria phaeospora]|uniref:Uncharacterized protein n=1 Tax=Massariosphaeria phaeospora TaxID=100035 RepID=A0A7C8M1C9_9PLEO|nr:hypothetical protein BDV95DRAFT_261519 [Massariosphaeria phaeospora]